MTACAHGLPDPACCVECMAYGPVAVLSVGDAQLLPAERWTTARFWARCQRRHSHEIRPGDRIGLVDGVGWCCDGCAR